MASDQNKQRQRADVMSDYLINKAKPLVQKAIATLEAEYADIEEPILNELYELEFWTEISYETEMNLRWSILGIGSHESASLAICPSDWFTK